MNVRVVDLVAVRSGDLLAVHQPPAVVQLELAFAVEGVVFDGRRDDERGPRAGRDHLAEEKIVVGHTRGHAEQLARPRPHAAPRIVPRRALRPDLDAQAEKDGQIDQVLVSRDGEIVIPCIDAVGLP